MPVWEEKKILGVRAITRDGKLSGATDRGRKERQRIKLYPFNVVGGIDVLAC